jgi:hypothetical protein
VDKATSHARRDQLFAIQHAAQARWAEGKVFEVDAPEGGQPVPEGKFFGNFPYPYMNGVLHLGHAFSISKLEFAAAFHRLCGKRTLFPQAFHCTGTAGPSPPSPSISAPPHLPYHLPPHLPYQLPLLHHSAPVKASPLLSVQNLPQNVFWGCA